MKALLAIFTLHSADKASKDALFGNIVLTVIVGLAAIAALAYLTNTAIKWQAKRKRSSPRSDQSNN